MIRHWNGAAWEDASFGAGLRLTGVTGTASGDLYVASESGSLMRRDALGRWTPVRTNGLVTINSMSGAGNAVVWGGDDHQIYRLVRTFSW